MKKILTTFSLYSGEKDELYTKYIAPRFNYYANKHGLEFKEFNKDNFLHQTLHPEFDWKENMHFNRWMIFKKMLNTGEITDGDYIYNFDADVFIKDVNSYICPSQGFTYAIDSGNTHCFGFFILHINEFSRRLIDLIIDRERWLKVSKYIFWNEHFNKWGTWHIADQQMYYTTAGIKPHSWKSFYNLPHCGFHSYPTEHTIFSLKELKENVLILPTEWNVTQLLEETGECGKRNKYDIVHCTREDTIFRHFAGGQRWMCKEYDELFPMI